MIKLASIVEYPRKSSITRRYCSEACETFEKGGATHPSNGLSRDQAVASPSWISFDFYRRSRDRSNSWREQVYKEKGASMMDGQEKYYSTPRFSVDE